MTRRGLFLAIRCHLRYFGDGDGPSASILVPSESESVKDRPQLKTQARRRVEGENPTVDSERRQRQSLTVEGALFS